eukprot:SAG31_NODE_593_length_13721_cov_5.192175_3_plen_1231_part_00
MGNISCSTDAPGGCGSDDAPAGLSQPDETEPAALRMLTVGALRRRALAAGVRSEMVELARDAHDPKAALVDLLVQRQREVGALADVLPALEGSPEDGVEVIGRCLEHSMEVLEVLESASLSRRLRKHVTELLDRVEALSETFDATWCAGLAQCGSSEIQRLGSCIVAVQKLARFQPGDAVLEDGAAQEAVLGVMALLERLERCGSTALRSLTVLTSVPAGEQNDDAIIVALEALHDLPFERLGERCDEEVAAAVAILPHMTERCPKVDVRVSANRAMFALGCRNGLAVVDAEDVWDGLCSSFATGMKPLVEQAAVSGGSGVSTGAFSLAAASGVLVGLCEEIVCKSAPSRRASMESYLHGEAAAERLGTAKPLSQATIEDLITTLVQRRQLLDLSGNDSACGYCQCVMDLLYARPQLAQAAESIGAYQKMWAVYRRMFPTSLPAEWWAATTAVVDFRTALMVSPWLSLALPVRYKPMAASWTSCSWSAPLLREIIHVVKVNHLAELSERSSMAAHPIMIAHIAMRSACGNIPSVHPQLLESGMLDALEYTCLHDFSLMGRSLAAEAAGVLVALVGRNEGGKMLNRSAITSMMAELGRVFKFEGRWQVRPVAAALPNVENVATMAISDANKMLMLESKNHIDTLLSGLLLDSPRRSEPGADAVQEASAELLLSLALYRPWSEALRTNAHAIRALHDLCDGDAGTAASRRSAERTLFELEGRKTTAPAVLGVAGGSSSQIMISYCWEQQIVIKRVHAALIQRSYNVWIDIEQMTGSAVDAMAGAVEAAAVMLFGVSQQYKESTNCRLEAQYAMQREVPLVPLMLVDGYRADGWLGMLMGAKIWYGFYGAVLSTDSLFESKVSELCRELGDRGQAIHAGMSHEHKTAHDSNNGRTIAENPDPVDMQPGTDAAPESNLDICFRQNAETRLHVLLDCIDLALTLVSAIDRSLVARDERRGLYARLNAHMDALETVGSQLTRCVRGNWNPDCGSCAELLRCCKTIREARPCEASVHWDAVVKLVESLDKCAVSMVSRRDEVAALLSQGTQASVSLLIRALRHALDAADRLEVNTPRASRQPLRLLTLQFESLVERMDLKWCTRISGCDETVLKQIGEAVTMAEMPNPDVETLDRLISVLDATSEPIIDATRPTAVSSGTKNVVSSEVTKDIAVPKSQTDVTASGLEDVQRLDLCALRTRCLAAGVGAHAVDEAADSEFPKANLAELLLEACPHAFT